MEMAFAAQILEFRAYGRLLGHYTRSGVTSGWAVNRPERGIRPQALDSSIGEFITRRDGRERLLAKALFSFLFPYGANIALGSAFQRQYFGARLRACS
jgi:hypothetical protein